MADLPDGLIADLKRDEGYSPTIYLDSEGLRTIGWGTLLENGIAEEEAEFMLTFRVGQYYAELLEACPFVGFTPEIVRCALANMYYNLGRSRFLGFKKMLAAIENGNYDLAADEALDSNWAPQVGARAERIAEMIRGAS